MSAYLEAEWNYWCQPSRGSRGIDITALADPDSSLPHLAIEAGTKSKSVKQAFIKLLDPKTRMYAGMLPLVVRKLKRKNRIVLRWHATSGKHGTDNFLGAIEEARELAA